MFCFYYSLAIKILLLGLVHSFWKNILNSYCILFLGDAGAENII